MGAWAGAWVGGWGAGGNILAGLQQQALLLLLVTPTDAVPRGQGPRASPNPQQPPTRAPTRPRTHCDGRVGLGGRAGHVGGGGGRGRKGVNSRDGPHSLSIMGQRQALRPSPLPPPAQRPPEAPHPPHRRGKSVPPHVRKGGGGGWVGAQDRARANTKEGGGGRRKRYSFELLVALVGRRKGESPHSAEPPASIGWESGSGPKWA